MKIDFDGIQAFVAVIELGGFSKAATKLHLSQTALTRRIQKLESYLGVQLLDRTTRYVSLTVVGRDFLPQAQNLVNEATLSVERLKNISRHSFGNFTLACIPSMAARILPGLIRQYADSCPGNRIRILDARSFEVCDALLKQQAELGISIHSVKNTELLEWPLFTDQLMFFCSHEHPFSQRRSVAWSEMQRPDMIVVSNMTATRTIMDYHLIKNGIQLGGAYEVQHHATALSLVCAGVGCAILPASTMPEDGRGGVCRIPLVSPVVERKVVLCQHRNKSLSPAAQAFFALANTTSFTI